MAQCQYCNKLGRTYADKEGSSVILCRSCLQHRFRTLPCKAIGEGVHCEGGEMIDSATYQSTGRVCHHCHGHGFLVEPKKRKNLKYLLYLRPEEMSYDENRWIKIKEFGVFNDMLMYVAPSPPNRPKSWGESDVLTIKGYQYKYLVEEV